MKRTFFLAIFLICKICIIISDRNNKENKDLYKALELTKRATKEEIKKQYRKLTRKYHPDISPGTKDLFTSITEAYEILSDPKTRRIYDTKGYQAAKSAQNSPDNNHDDMDMLSRFFGGQVKRENKNDDMRIKLKASLEDLYNGKEYDFKYTRKIICPHCRGSGAESEQDIKTCTKCKGTGAILETRQIAPGYIQQFQKQCTHCSGKGNIVTKECHVCHSSKIIPALETLSVFVEKGMKNGQEIVRTNILNFRLTMTPETNQPIKIQVI
jgi:DnaJ-related protein SCJ1